MPHLAAIFLLTAAALAYEVALTRIFSITQWYHFAYMVISIALLGFGASGTFLSLARERLLGRFSESFTLFALLFSLTVYFCFVLMQRIPFEPFLLIWDRRQLLHLLAYYMLLFLPFFFVATCIGLAFMRYGEHINRIYFLDLAGSGLGVLLVVLLLNYIHPSKAIAWITAVGFAATLVSALSLKRLSLLLAPVTLAVSFYALKSDVKLNISQYKGLSSSLNLPEARIEDERYSPLGLIQVVSSPAIRNAPGLSLAFSGDIPRQHELFVDAESAGCITRFDGDLSKLAYLDWTTSALPYHLLHRPRTLIVGAGGGGDVLLALYHNAEKVDALEVNPKIIDLIKNKYADFTSNLYRRPEVSVYPREARSFVESASSRYDLIQVSLIDSFGATTAGIYALTENYLYTVEAFERFFSRLSDRGMLSITRWLRQPPHDNIKIFATAVEALERCGVAAPAKHLAFVRSWATATLLVKRDKFTPEEIDDIYKFCDQRLFDLIFYDGIDADETNQHNILSELTHYEAVQAILSPQRESFYRRYPFNVRPATDDKPYFFHFFKWRSLPLILRTMGPEWVSFFEWGYVVLVATLVQALLVSALLILIPLLALRDRPRSGELKTLAYFSCLGLGFIFIEMTFIQRFLLFLGHPTYALSVVLATFLFFSGLGSLTARRLNLRSVDSIAFAGALIAALALAYLAAIKPLFGMLAGASDSLKFLASLLLIAPIAFFMGMPFPLGLQRLASRAPQLVPWAWGVNSCASVLSTGLAMALAMSLGFNAVLVIAAALYFIAILTRPMIE